MPQRDHKTLTNCANFEHHVSAKTRYGTCIHQCPPTCILYTDKRTVAATTGRPHALKKSRVLQAKLLTLNSVVFRKSSQKATCKAGLHFHVTTNFEITYPREHVQYVPNLPHHLTSVTGSITDRTAHQQCTNIYFHWLILIPVEELPWFTNNTH